MKWKPEIYFVGNTYEVNRCKFVNTLPGSDTTAMYYDTKNNYDVVVNQQYIEPEILHYDAERRTFTDRKEAYDYAISKMKKRIVEIQSRIDSYEYRKHGFCTTTINGEASEHEVDEYSWD